ncbi:MAG: type II toxin-antitoxin system VapC family toxin [Acidobacteriota bacterium]|nr:type II toxin-antitoxin system VapC family toxin [Acidobacteriota bacterium]
MVLDASVALELLLRTPAGARLAERLEGGEPVHAPHLIDIEVAHALRRLVRTGLLDSRRGAEVLEDLADLDLDRHPHTVLLGGVWQWRHNLSAYDAAYVVLAEILGQPLVTGDARIAAAPRLPIDVEHV